MRRSGSRARDATTVSAASTTPVTRSCTCNEMPAAAARLATSPPTTAPADQTAWKRVMIERWLRCCSSTAWEFMATSVSPSRAPSTSRAENTSTAVGAKPRIGSHSDIAADVATVVVRLPRRSTSHPLKELAARPPRPIPTSVSPRAPSEMPSSRCSSGSRGVHDEYVAPFTKNTAPTAIAGRRSGAPAATAPGRGCLGWSAMAQATIYHNPRCTKSRQAMQAVEELGVEVDIVRYLDTPPDEATLRAILAKLDDPPADLVRRERWAELGVTAADVATVDGVVAVLVAHPELMQRPVVVKDGRAVIGRPTERVTELMRS